MKHPDIDEKDTARLSTRPDVPPEIRRALQALKAEGPSRRTMDLVASRLGSLLDAPPPAVQPAQWLWRGLGARAVALRVGVAALTIGTAAVWLRPAARQQAESVGPPSALDAQREVVSPLPAPSAAAPSASPPSPQVAVPEAPSSGSARTHIPDRSGADRAGSAEPAAAALPAERASARGRSRRSRGVSAGVPAAVQALDAPAPSVGTGARLSEASSELATLPESPLPARAEVVGPTPDAGVVRAPAAPPEVRLPSEVALMLDARRLAGRDPRAAQRLLEQHTTRFPEGVLAPEREVLAIEVLRALGQTSEAEQRMQAFRALYPNSMHLRRLSNPPAQPGR